MIRLYLKIQENFVRLIFQNGFWVVHIPFFRMVKCKLLAPFPVDHLPYPIMCGLILFCANLLQSHIIKLIVLSRSQYNLHLIYILALTELVLRALFYAAIRKDSVSLSGLHFLSHVQLLSFACLSLRISVQLFFFSFVYSGYFCSVDACIISGLCNQTSSAFSNLILELFFFKMKSGESSSSFFPWHL